MKQEYKTAEELNQTLETKIKKKLRELKPLLLGWKVSEIDKLTLDLRDQVRNESFFQ